MQSPERTRGVAARAVLCAALSSAALAYTGLAQAEVPFAPTRDVASKCRKLAYQAYPYQRPGHTQGSGARYALFKDCIDKPALSMMRARCCRRRARYRRRRNWVDCRHRGRRRNSRLHRLILPSDGMTARRFRPAPLDLVCGRRRSATSPA
jgi:hypothetical protein